MTASLDMNSQNIINVLSPNDNLHVANKAYVDSLLSGTTDTGSAQLRVDLADTANTEGASLVGVEDSAGYYTGTNVETILAELGATTGAAIIGLADSGGYYTGTDIEAALAERKPIGMGSIAGYAVGAGTVNAITANFTPDISLTTGVMIAIIPAGAITSTTPTLAVDGLTAKTIVKGDSQVLSLNDINSTTQILLLMYTASGEWQLLNPRTPAGVVDSTHDGGLTYIENSTGGHTTVSTISTVGAAGAWESYGPTGSGADNIVTQMDNYPTGATAVILRLNTSVEGASNGVTYSVIVHGRTTGSSAGASSNTTLVGATVINRSGSTEHTKDSATVFVPLDGSLRFDLHWTETGTTPTSSVTAIFVGYIV